MQIGKNIWLLIGLTFLELIFVILPALISSKIEAKPLKYIIKEMGFQKNKDIFLKVLEGLSFGIIFFFFSKHIIIFFKDIIIRNLFGAEFIKQAQEGSISTVPIHFNYIQLIILILQQIIIIGPCEEAFFRVFLIKKFKTKLKLVYSILLSSIIFTIYHVPPFFVPLATIVTFSGYYFTFGLLLSFILICFNFSIIPGSISHSFFNILLIVL
jgi:membrane protease YdiL (CAAX protease family)